MQKTRGPLFFISAHKMNLLPKVSVGGVPTRNATTRPKEEAILYAETCKLSALWAKERFFYLNFLNIVPIKSQDFYLIIYHENFKL